MLTEKIKAIHVRALDAADRYKRSEADLIEIFQELDFTKGFLFYGAESLYAYGVNVLNLSEGIVLSLITVARKAKVIPELKEAIRTKDITLSQAKKIASVITPVNQEDWLEFAKVSTSREIEKEVARMNPDEAICERIKYVTAERLEIKFGISEKLDSDFKRVKDLIAQNSSGSPTSEDAFSVLVAEFLKKHDPLLKAERIAAKKKPKSQVLVPKPRDISNSGPRVLSAEADRPALSKTEVLNRETIIAVNSDVQVSASAEQQFPGTVLKTPASKISRRKLPAHIEHAVYLRDQGRCTHLDRGKRCTQTRWIHFHHVIPKFKGGEDTLENLTTLCSSHHRFTHREQRFSSGRTKDLGMETTLLEDAL